MCPSVCAPNSLSVITCQSVRRRGGEEEGREGRRREGRGGEGGEGLSMSLRSFHLENYLRSSHCTFLCGYFVAIQSLGFVLVAHTNGSLAVFSSSQPDGGVNKMEPLKNHRRTKDREVWLYREKKRLLEIVWQSRILVNLAHMWYVA